ncbi:MAG TPA: diphthine--ammonia ligase [Nitrososphaerales archaeon]|nr:diphthine--ammonia ligase [Nitrososphaerales archaeon]
MVRAGVLFSGGKDSTYAARTASKEGELACLITLFPESQMSYMFHYPNLRWTKLQAEAIGVPQLTRGTPGVKEEELDDMREALDEATKKYGIDSVYTGALASVYQKTRVEKVCQALGLDCISPLWGIDPESHLRRLVKEGFSVVVVSVSALGLDQSWLGRKLDDSSIDELVKLGRKFRFNVGLEGGEGETFVTDCPLFKRAVAIDKSAPHWAGDSGYLEIKKAHLESLKSA